MGWTDRKVKDIVIGDLIVPCHGRCRSPYEVMAILSDPVGQVVFHLDTCEETMILMYFSSDEIVLVKVPDKKTSITAYAVMLVDTTTPTHPFKELLIRDGVNNITMQLGTRAWEIASEVGETYEQAALALVQRIEDPRRSATYGWALPYRGSQWPVQKTEVTAGDLQMGDLFRPREAHLVSSSLECVGLLATKGEDFPYWIAARKAGSKDPEIVALDPTTIVYKVGSHV